MHFWRPNVHTLDISRPRQIRSMGYYTWSSCHFHFYSIFQAKLGLEKQKTRFWWKVIDFFKAWLEMAVIHWGTLVWKNTFYYLLLSMTFQMYIISTLLFFKNIFNISSKCQFTVNHVPKYLKLPTVSIWYTSSVKGCNLLIKWKKKNQ